MITDVSKTAVMSTTGIAVARDLAHKFVEYMKQTERMSIGLTEEEALHICRALLSVTSESPDPHDIEGDALVGTLPTGLEYLSRVAQVCDIDAATIITADKAYGGSWQKRGGIGAFMMLARKWDRLEIRVTAHGSDIFTAVRKDTRREGVIDDVRDLRRYLTLVEAVCLYNRWVQPQGATKESDA